jgi:regulator of cell morphogenesis and NO signaling
MTHTAPIHDAAALTRYIETRYHARHREQLPELAEMAERVEVVHFGEEDVPEGLSVILHRMNAEMEVHMKKEELILFPAIRKGGGPGTQNPIAEMRANHDDHAADLAEIRRLTAGMVVPEGACGTWTALYARLKEFVDELEEHMRLKNESLFPQFEASDPVPG